MNIRSSLKREVVKIRPMSPEGLVSLEPQGAGHTSIVESPSLPSGWM